MPEGYVYDIAGNIIQDATNGQKYTYDQENRITGAVWGADPARKTWINPITRP